MEKERVVAYYRTSSGANVGEDKDSKTRQQSAVKLYAEKSNMDIVAEFYDAEVKGAVPAMVRPSFKKMFDYMKSKNIDKMLVECADRFARDLMVQMNALALLKDNGMSVIPVNAPDHFNDETPTSKFIRVILGAIAELDKDQIVSKLKSGKEKKRAMTGRCEGRIPPSQEAIELAKKLRAEGMPYRAIGAELSNQGFRVLERNAKTKAIEVTDRIYQAMSVKNMIENL
jgi:DNA invertase Pin-like site-specific DNA recombinase